MKGTETFQVAVNMLGGVVDEIPGWQSLDRSAIDWLLPHQVNMQIIQSVAKRLELPMDRVIVTVQDHSNTSAASIPLALDLDVRGGRIKRGDLLLLEGFSGGLNSSSALVRY
jgi:3-oxoacyl-[acyl-carrier-protein] synthase III